MKYAMKRYLTRLNISLMYKLFNFVVVKKNASLRASIQFGLYIPYYTVTKYLATWPLLEFPRLQLLRLLYSQLCRVV